MAWCVLAAGLLAQQNPEYTYWARCQPGSWVKLRMKIDQAGQEILSEMTVKLMEVTKEKVVVERSGTATVGDRTVPVPADRDEVLAEKKQEKIEDLGEKEITVAGKSLRCRLMKTVKEEGGVTRTARVWVSEEIPGGVAKLEVVPEGAEKPVVTGEALSWEKK